MPHRTPGRTVAARALLALAAIAAATGAGAGPEGRASAAAPTARKTGAPAAAVPQPSAPASPAPPAAASPRGPYCSGEYADDLSALSPGAREFEQAAPNYTFCIRTSAVYECPFYGSDGALKRRRVRVVAHGSGFAYRRDGAETLLVTNEHVADWPAVTDADHPVTDVPPGCRRVYDALKIVDNEADTYERDDVALARVVADQQLDVAVLRAKEKLPVMPWKVGHSAALRERNAVDVRGFPLGALRATNVGKVTSAFQRDDERDWDHDDFVVDALLSSGNSGSPVFAVSCRTGEFELVGVYHAGYGRANAINVVVGIDQVRPLLDTLKRSARVRPEPALLDAGARARIDASLAAGAEPFFPFGATSAAARARADGALVFEVVGRDFPARSQPVLVIEDLPSREAGEFGHMGPVWAGDGYGLHRVDHASLDAEGQAQLAKLLDVLRRDALLAATYRSAVLRGVSTRERYNEVARLERSVRRLVESRRDLAQSALDLADRLSPRDADATATLADVLAGPPPTPAAAVSPISPAVSAPVPVPEVGPPRRPVP